MPVPMDNNGHTAMRWFIGILFAIALGMIGYLWGEVNKIRDQVYSEGGQSTRALLDERTAIYVPIILQNRVDIATMQRQVDRNADGIARNDKRLDRLEGRR